MRLLLINPNTSVHITERLAVSARDVLTPQDELTAVTAADGPAVVQNAQHLRRAELSALTLAAAHAQGHDAIVLGISLDGAAPRLRSRHPGLAVVGMTEAALMTACLHSERIGLLTFGASLLPLYRQRVEQTGLASRVIAYEAPECARAFAAGTERVDAAVLDPLAAGCERLRRSGAQAVVLAGAVLCGYAAPLATRCGLATFDGVACAVGQIRILLTLRDSRMQPGLESKC